MRRQLVPGPVVRLTVIKAKTRPGIEATKEATVPPSHDLARQALLFLRRFVLSFFVPPIFTVFYLIDRVTKNRKGEAAKEAK